MAKRNPLAPRPHGDLPDILQDPARFAGVRHLLCAEHVPMEGLREPVCILRGQDREAVLADAREVLGAGPYARPHATPTPIRSVRGPGVGPRSVRGGHRQHVPHGGPVR